MRGMLEDEFDHQEGEGKMTVREGTPAMSFEERQAGLISHNKISARALGGFAEVGPKNTVPRVYHR